MKNTQGTMSFVVMSLFTVWSCNLSLIFFSHLTRESISKPKLLHTKSLKYVRNQRTVLAVLCKAE